MYRYKTLSISRAEKHTGLLFTTRLICIRTSDFSQFFQVFYSRCRPFRRNGVVHPFAFFSSNNNTGITKNFHMVRHCRLCDIDLFKQFASTFLTCRKKFQNTNTVFIAERFENHCDFLFIKLQTRHLPSISINIICNTSMFVNGDRKKNTSGSPPATEHDVFMLSIQECEMERAGQGNSCPAQFIFALNA